MSYGDREFVGTAIVLAVALGFLCLLPSWWRGSWHASRVRWRDRAWLVTVLAVIAACVATLLIRVLETEDSDVMWLWGTGMSLYLVAAVLVLLIPLVARWRRFDFAVPPRLRTQPEWAEAKTLRYGNRQERRRKARR